MATKRRKTAGTRQKSAAARDLSVRKGADAKGGSWGIESLMGGLVNKLGNALNTGSGN